MAPSEKKNDKTVDEMRAAITALTGRTCMSKDPAHLRRRLADLQRLQEAGRQAADTTTVMSVSMHGKAKAAARRIADEEGIGISELVRRALCEWARENGHRSEASNFEVE